MIHVYGLPELVEPTALRGGTAIVIDVLRATTTMVSAIYAGAQCVVPFLEVDETLKFKQKLIAGEDPRFPQPIAAADILLGGERQGKRIDGFDLGNSPREYTPDRVAGKTILFSTTNGTKAIHRAALADSILPASFLNVGAIVEHVSNCESLNIICAGTDGQLTEEDLYLAGLLVDRIQRATRNRFQLNAQAIAAQATWHQIFEKTPVTQKNLAPHLYRSRGGLNLQKIGLQSDVDRAANVDSIPLIVKIDPKKMILETDIL